MGEEQAKKIDEEIEEKILSLPPRRFLLPGRSGSGNADWVSAFHPASHGQLQNKQPGTPVSSDHFSLRCRWLILCFGWQRSLHSTDLSGATRFSNRSVHSRRARLYVSAA